MIYLKIHNCLAFCLAGKVSVQGRMQGKITNACKCLQLACKPLTWACKCLQAKCKQSPLDLRPRCNPPIGVAGARRAKNELACGPKNTSPIDHFQPCFSFLWAQVELSCSAAPPARAALAELPASAGGWAGAARRRNEITRRRSQMTDINHGYAELLAQSVRYRYTAAIEALELLQAELRKVEKGPVAGVIPSEVFAGYLYDTDEMPLSVHYDAAWLLEEMGRQTGSLLADVTDTPIWRGDEEKAA